MTTHEHRERAKTRVDQGTREKLISITLEVILREGISAVRVDQVAAEADVTKGSVYWHFKDREELIRAALGEHLRKTSAQTIEGVSHAMHEAKDKSDYLTLIAPYLANPFDIEQADERWNKLDLLVQSRRDPLLAEMIRHFQINNQEVLVELMELAQTHGYLRNDVDPRAVATMLSAVYLGSNVIDMLGENAPTPEAWWNLLFFFISSLFPDPGTAQQ